MAIITTITTNGIEVEIRQTANELLNDLSIEHKPSLFMEETMRKVSNSMSGMIPSLKGNTEVALVPHAGINP